MHALPPRVALVPNAIAFRDPAHGILGGGWTSCVNRAFACSPQGTVQLTSDGGRTWRVVLRTTLPVVRVGYEGKGFRIVLADGANRVSADGAHGWRPAPPLPTPASPCPKSLFQPYWSGNWVLCTGEGGAGAGGKAVYRYANGMWRQLAVTPFPPPGRSRGGISIAGYALGIAMAPDAFGLIWESRGTLYVTRDGGTTLDRPAQGRRPGGRLRRVGDGAAARRRLRRAREPGDDAAAPARDDGRRPNLARRAPLALKPRRARADQHGMVIVLRLALAVWVCLAAMGVLMFMH